MSNAKTSLHPGMTALAAVLAISSTPLLAQNVDGTTAAPATEASAPALAVPPPVVTSETAAPEVSAPIATTPAVESTVANTPPPAAATAVEQAPAPVARTARRAEPKAAAAAPVATAPAATTAALPVAVEPAPLPMPAPEAAAPVTASQATMESTSTNSGVGAEDILPFAGAGALIVGGAAYALARRKRRRVEDDVFTEDDMPAESVADTDMTWSPAPSVAVRHAPMASASDAKLPEGFDLSIYGPHVQQAYRGPTADNPSLSLTRRLKRARFFDQRDRRLQTGSRKIEAAPAFSSWQNNRVLEPAY